MDNLHKVIEEDFKAAFEAFRVDSFDHVNIFANRIMSNAIFDDDSTVFLVGSFLKDLAFTYGVIKASKAPVAFSTSKSHGLTFLENIKKMLPSPNEEQLWKEFHNYSNNIRKFEITDFEEKSYSENVEFTKKAFLWLVSYLKANRDVLFDSYNLLIKGVINEMSRIFKVHSGTLSETVLMALMEALDRYYEYIRRIYTKPSMRLVSEEKVKGDIFPLIDQIETLYGQELSVKEADVILWKLVRSWRELFIQYMELPVGRFAVQKGIELPEELKKKLSEAVTKTLEKEI